MSDAYADAYERALAWGEANPDLIEIELNTALDNEYLAVSYLDWTGYVAGLRAAKARQADHG